jgi:glucitol operon activator protein
MSFTRDALALLLVFWILQIIGTWFQVKNYRTAMAKASSDWKDGFLGAGQSRPRFGAGCLVLLEVGPDLVVRRLQVMSGMTIFARFQPQADFVGWPLSRLRDRFAESTDDSRLARAVRQAADKIEEARRRT